MLKGIGLERAATLVSSGLNGPGGAAVKEAGNVSSNEIC
jgi:hypothetical protein